MKSEKIQLDWPLVGNQHILDFLGRMIINSANSPDDSSLTGAYIFYGQENLGKTTIAYAFARSVMCQKRQKGGERLPCGECRSCQQFKQKEGKSGNLTLESVHSDLYVIKKDEDKKNISINQIREFIANLGMSSFLDSYKIGIIKNADTLSEEAANALLKTLEEPRAKVMIILIAEDLDSMPLTIRSRSQILRFNPVPADVIYHHLIEKYKVGRSDAKKLSRLAHGSPAIALKLRQESDFYENYLGSARIFLGFFQQNINERLSTVDDLIGRKLSGQESCQIVYGLMDVWRSLVRDLFLVKCGQVDLIHFEPLKKELGEISEKKDWRGWLNVVKYINEAERFVAANVGAKNALENIVINI